MGDQQEHARWLEVATARGEAGDLEGANEATRKAEALTEFLAKGLRSTGPGVEVSGMVTCTKTGARGVQAGDCLREAVALSQMRLPTKDMVSTATVAQQSDQRALAVQATALAKGLHPTGPGVEVIEVATCTKTGDGLREDVAVSQSTSLAR